MVVKGDKVILRPMKPRDVGLIHKWANNPDVMPFWYGRKKSLKEIKDDWKPQYFSSSNPNSGRCFAIEVDNKTIGMVNYNKIDRDNRNVTIDIVIGEKDNWNRGYGTDVLRTFLKYLFEEFKLHRVWLGTYMFNKRAIRVYENVGFRREGLLREDALIGNKYEDTVILGVLKDEFESKQSGNENKN